MYSLFTHSAHTKKLLSVGVCFFERVFRPLLVTQLFHAKKEEKKEKKFSPFFFVCKSKPNKTLF